MRASWPGRFTEWQTARGTHVLVTVTAIAQTLKRRLAPANSGDFVWAGRSLNLQETKSISTKKSTFWYPLALTWPPTCWKSLLQIFVLHPSLEGFVILQQETRSFLWWNIFFFSLIYWRPIDWAFFKIFSFTRSYFISVCTSAFVQGQVCSIVCDGTP